ncbi:unnamed protein product [Caenorhabditis angaria]|uniref:Uncharacterized protein n=1 Tax=Caenorhabditis angaria TaxID=860376 RepID=A0A9P1J595_9PELO|nr:unnamed protein product [Caenorhabditis angaria]
MDHQDFNHFPSTYERDDKSNGNGAQDTDFCPRLSDSTNFPTPTKFCGNFDNTMDYTHLLSPRFIKGEEMERIRNRNESKTYETGEEGELAGYDNQLKPIKLITPKKFYSLQNNRFSPLKLDERHAKKTLRVSSASRQLTQKMSVMSINDELKTAGGAEKSTLENVQKLNGEFKILKITDSNYDVQNQDSSTPTANAANLTVNNGEIADVVGSLLNEF